jgi:hypothetical protein
VPAEVPLEGGVETVSEHDMVLILVRSLAVVLAAVDLLVLQPRNFRRR